MTTIFQFLKMLFLAEAILLTPTPIDIQNHWLEMPLVKPLEAIASGASVQVRFDIEHPYFRGSENISSAADIADQEIPEGTFEAQLIDAEGNVLVLARRAILLGSDDVLYGIFGEKPIPVGIKYPTLRIRSNKPISNVTVYWKNYRL